MDAAQRIIEIKDRAGMPEQQHQADGKAEVANAVDDEGFLGRVVGIVFSEVMTDEQI